MSDRKHRLRIKHVPGDRFGIILRCEECEDPEHLSCDYAFVDHALASVFDPPDPGKTDDTVAQLINFLARHDAFGLTECEHEHRPAMKESVQIGKAAISLWGQAE